MRLNQRQRIALSAQLSLGQLDFGMGDDTPLVKIGVEAIRFEGRDAFNTWTPRGDAQNITLSAQLFECWTHLLHGQQRLFEVDATRLALLQGRMTITLCVKLVAQVPLLKEILT